MVPEDKGQVIRCRRCKLVPEEHCCEVPYTTCRLVAEEKCYQVPRTTCHLEPYCVKVQTCRQVPVCVPICEPVCPPPCPPGPCSMKLSNSEWFARVSYQVRVGQENNEAN